MGLVAQNGGRRSLGKPYDTITQYNTITIKEDIEFIRRQDIEFDFEGVETCFIEIPRQKKQKYYHWMYLQTPLSRPIIQIPGHLTRKIEFYEPVWLRNCVMKSAINNRFKSVES